MTHPAADRLFERSLLGLLVSGFLALASTGELPPVVLGLSVAGFTARILLLIFQRSLPIPAVLINTLVILYAGFYPLDFTYLSGDFLGSTVRLICFLTVVKGLTFRTDRDAYYAVLIGFTQLLAAALLSASLLFFVFLAIFLFCGVTAFSVWEIRRGGRGARRRKLRSPPARSRSPRAPRSRWRSCASSCRGSTTCISRLST